MNEAKEMIDLSQYAEDKINIWFADHPEKRLLLDNFVEKNNLQNQSLGLIILTMTNEEQKQFTGLLKMILDMSKDILKTMGMI